MKTSSKQKEQEIGSQRKIVIFEDPDQKWGEIEQNQEQENLPGEKNVKESWRVNEQNPEQENWSGDSGVKGNGRDVEQDLEDKILSGEFRWMSRTYKLEPAVETCSVVDSPVDNNSRISEIDTYSDRNSITGSELSELAILAMLVETRSRDSDREVDQDPEIDRYLVPSERVFDNAADDLKTVAVSKRSMSLLAQKEAARTDLQLFRQGTVPLVEVWCVKLEDDAYQPDELSSQLRVMKTYLKARYRLSDLLGAQRNDRMTSNLKRWIENGAIDKGNLEETVIVF